MYFYLFWPLSGNAVLLLREKSLFSPEENSYSSTTQNSVSCYWNECTLCKQFCLGEFLSSTTVYFLLTSGVPHTSLGSPKLQKSSEQYFQTCTTEAFICLFCFNASHVFTIPCALHYTCTFYAPLSLNVLIRQSVVMFE